MERLSRQWIRLAGLAGVFATAACFPSSLDRDVGLETPVLSGGFADAMEDVAGTPWIPGNRVTTLINGDGFFPPMLEAVQSAEKSITFETFAYVNAPVTREFSQALADRARAGVDVLMILDAVGSRNAGAANLALMREAGVEVCIYHPINILRPQYSNNRTHRKILVVDGEVAFTGGAGFAHAWTGRAHSPEFWRDTQYEIRGPAVAGFQSAFAENWFEMTGEKLTGPAYFPPLARVGPTRVQVVIDDPWNDTQPIADGVLAAINGARGSLLLAQSYFIPNADFRLALKRAADRGVEIRVILPNHLVDSKPTRHASQNHWVELLGHGIRIFEYQGTMMHGKLLVADGRFCIVGSGNFDARTFFINEENNLHVDCRDFAREQGRMFANDLRRCREVTSANLPGVLEPFYKRFLSRLIEQHL